MPPSSPKTKRRCFAPGRFAALGLMFSATMTATAVAPIAAYAAEPTLVVAAGQTYTVDETTTLSELTIEAGGAIVAPEGKSVTLVVDGVETGQRYANAGALATAISAGTFSGDVVLVVTPAMTSTFQKTDFSVRTSLSVADGAVSDSSVRESWAGGTVTGTDASGFTTTSTGAGFNGIYVANSDYAVNGGSISLTGNGRSDFAGVGAGIVGTGANTTLVVDGVTIDNTGVARGGITSTDGANVIVKNSKISVADGELPADYQTTVDLTKMLDAPWMLGVKGNNRATLLLGENSKASYVNSTLHADGWGVLSTDAGTGVQLTSINNDVSTGDSGYGLYAIGNANEEILGTNFSVGDYIGIITHNETGNVHFGDSTPAAVLALNDGRSIGLDATELAALISKPVNATSGRIGLMWHGGGVVDIDGGTVFSTQGPVFQDKGTSAVPEMQSVATINADGSEGAQFTSAEGIILQVMENDDPGPVMVDGNLVNAGVYNQPTEPAAKDANWDLTATNVTSGTIANLKALTLTGDIFNAARSNKNLVLNLDGTTITGLISASTTVHKNGVTQITADNWQDIGEVDNTVAEPVNNGVIVNLAGASKWTVPGTSYLSSLTVGADASIVGPDGAPALVTVDGKATVPEAGKTYTGEIVVAPAVALFASTVDVAVDPASITQGHSATVTATVKPGTTSTMALERMAPPVATGSVIFTVDGNDVGTANVVDGVATFALPSDIAVGKHEVTATYSGDAQIAGATGQGAFEVVAAPVAPTATSTTSTGTGTGGGLATTGSDFPGGVVAALAALALAAGVMLQRRKQSAE